MNFSLLSKKKILIIGLGISGISTAKKLQLSNVDVVGWDDNTKVRKKAQEKGIKIQNIEDINFRKIDILLLSPGIKSSTKNAHKSVILAKKYNCSVFCDLELISFLKKKPFTIGITGTNGKSTTTLFIEHIFKKLKIDAKACGNVGIPIMDLNINNENKKLIIESSSFQLEKINKLRFRIALLLNISVDHIEWHGSFENYQNAKLKIFLNQRKNDFAIISIDDNNCQKIAKAFKENFNSKLIKISTKKEIIDGIYLKSDEKNLTIFDNFFHNNFLIPKTKISFFKADHNYQNLLATYTACKILKITNKSFIKSISSFKGLEHRLEKFAVFKNITFYNDSKATNMNSSKVALLNLKNIYWILGGRAKTDGIGDIRDSLEFVDRIFTYGEASKDFHTDLKEVKKTLSFNLIDEAFLEAFKTAKKESGKINIVLSPACSSFDQFKNFEERGKYFKKIVKEVIIKN